MEHKLTLHHLQSMRFMPPLHQQTASSNTQIGNVLGDKLMTRCLLHVYVWERVLRFQSLKGMRHQRAQIMSG